MRFAKYHGIGNDFVMLADPEDRIEVTEAMAARLCDRRFGIGADGVIRVVPGGGGADFVMDYRNSDGSIGEMCGNGIRCLGVFARAEGLTTESKLQVDTGAGRKVITVLDTDRVRVDMGAPIFTPADIPIRWDGDPLHAKLETSGEVIEAACVSIGNPHAVLFVEDPQAAPVKTLGPELEWNPLFPNGTNVEFIRVPSKDRVEMRVWERGSGETLACGTGACAVAVVAKLLAGADDNVTVSLPGGELEIEWAGSLENEQPIYMTGPVVKAFEGDVDLELYR
ncbi:MAG TPA: diaminopimelate epimerase [Actinomycetota bacterium]|nr:diaminopimelate epimerase [Actinomycetota bacterium]